jgi:hypothetical protein
MFRHSQARAKTSPALTFAWIAAFLAAMSILTLPSAGAAANPDLRKKEAREVLDSRFHHDRYYPARGVAFRELPQAAQTIRFHETPYYFHGGSWYRPSRGVGFRVIAPPIGVLVPFLPSYYTTVWLGGMPYYYANDVYYQWLPDQREYIVATPPPEAALSTEPPGAPTDEPYIYPRNGQSEQQQATDRYECHAWAAQQSQYDPTQPAGNLSADNRSGYFRAMTACLESRGYSVK